MSLFSKHHFSRFVGDNEGAYRICSQVVSYLTLSLINMQKHPLLGVQLFTLGDLAGLCNHYEQAKAYYEWCFEVGEVMITQILA